MPSKTERDCIADYIAIFTRPNRTSADVTQDLLSYIRFREGQLPPAIQAITPASMAEIGAAYPLESDAAFFDRLDDWRADVWKHNWAFRDPEGIPLPEVDEKFTLPPTVKQRYYRLDDTSFVWPSDSASCLNSESDYEADSDAESDYCPPEANDEDESTTSSASESIKRPSTPVTPWTPETIRRYWRIALPGVEDRFLPTDDPSNRRVKIDW